MERSRNSLITILISTYSNYNILHTAESNASYLSSRPCRHTGHPSTRTSYPTHLPLGTASRESDSSNVSRVLLPSYADAYFTRRLKSILISMHPRLLLRFQSNRICRPPTYVRPSASSHSCGALALRSFPCPHWSPSQASSNPSHHPSTSTTTNSPRKSYPQTSQHNIHPFRLAPKPKKTQLTNHPIPANATKSQPPTPTVPFPGPSFTSAPCIRKYRMAPTNAANAAAPAQTQPNTVPV